jgi:tRNA/rRNA methyltransferase
MFAQLTTMLEPLGYFEPEIRAPSRAAPCGRCSPSGWNHLEVRTMRGILTTLARKPPSPAFGSASGMQKKRCRMPT